MGQVNHDPYIQHFSHPHLLELCNINPQSLPLYTAPCSACKLQPSGWIYICKLCNFTLHMSCSQMPTLITHPAHPMHSLTLLPTPAYPSGSFHCDGCGIQDQGFSYHCQHCDFDLHMKCASNPLLLTHQSHPHQLKLTFQTPYPNRVFSCDICHKFGSNHWLYRCDFCEFDAHLECAMSVITMPSTEPHFQQHNSFPAVNQYQQSRSSVINRPLGVNSYVPSQTMGAMQASYQRPNIGTNSGTGNALMNAMVQGFVDAAAQQAGQNLTQSIFNDGNSNNSDPNATGGNSSSLSSVVNIGSLLTGMFGT